MEYVSLRGHKVPALGLGTWLLQGSDCRSAVTAALDLGYRHIDTAQLYGNEAEIGHALSATTVPREEMFLTTKLWNDNHARTEVISYTEESLQRLGTDYVDLLLIHWPVELDRLGETLDAMGELADRGLTRNIGVSNFTVSQLQAALSLAPIACLQVEMHPFLDQSPLLAAAGEADVVVTAYSPLARGGVFTDPTLRAIGERYDKSPAQIALRWILDHDGVLAVPKASSRPHLAANLAVFDFALTTDERTQINGLARGERLIEPPFAPAWED
jgi:2,5-diketo-D-gluconate reductase B